MLTNCLSMTLALLAFAESAARESTFFPRILVQVKVNRVVYTESSKSPAGGQQVSFQVHHVYSGDSKLKGESFQADFLIDPTETRQPIVYPPFKEGDVAILVLDYDEDGKLTLGRFNYSLKPMTTGEGLAIPVPIRKIIGVNYGWPVQYISYNAGLKWAEAVETIYNSRVSERPALLRRYVTSNNPYIGAWSARMLFRIAPDDLLHFFKKVIEDSNLSIGAQVTIDELLSKNDKKEWLGSKQRMALLERWVCREIDDAGDLRMILARFERSLRDRTLDWDVWLSLMEKWITEHHLSESLEDDLFGSFKSTTYGYDSDYFPRRQRIFDRAVLLLKTTKDQNKQIYAARWLGYVGELSDKELKVIKSLQETISNPLIRLLLNAQIRRTESKNR